MRILFVGLDPPLPATNGHRIRTAAVLRALVADGHDVTLVSFHDPQDSVDMEGLKRLCRSVDLMPPAIEGTAGIRSYLGRLRSAATLLPYTVHRFSTREMRATLGRHLSRQAFDLVVCDEAYAMTDLPPTRPPVVVDTIQIAFLLLRRYSARARNPLVRLYAGLEYWKTRRWEIAAGNQASALVACSEAERRLYAELCPRTPVFLVPNVVDTEHFVPTDDPGGGTALYTGGMDWHPNRDAVEFFAASILPTLRELIPPVRFRVAGRAPAPEFRQRLESVAGVEFSGTVPDMRTEIARATVCVVPLRIGTGTRLKILEAGAMEKAMVSTHLGAEGLELTDGEEIVLVDDPAAFAREVARLLRDPARRRTMGQAARHRVVKQYGTPALQSALRDCLHHVTRRS